MIFAEYSQWQAERLKTVTAEDGWLNLTDRVEIAAAPQTIGSAADNAIMLGCGPAHLGTLLPRSLFQTADGKPHPYLTQKGSPGLRIPPCAFADFAICRLPRHKNILPFAVRAGELAL